MLLMSLACDAIALGSNQVEEVSMLASSAVDCGFESRSGQTKDYTIGICCFSNKHTALRRKTKDWLARNQDNVTECGDMYIRGRLFQ